MDKVCETKKPLENSSESSDSEDEVVVTRKVVLVRPVGRTEEIMEQRLPHPEVPESIHVNDDSEDDGGGDDGGDQGSGGDDGSGNIDDNIAEPNVDDDGGSSDNIDN